MSFFLGFLAGAGLLLVIGGCLWISRLRAFMRGFG